MLRVMGRMDDITHTSESSFTAPHSACASPHLWHAPDAHSSEVEVTELVAALVRAMQPDLVVETGTGLGFTARAVGGALSRNGHGHLVSLEVDAERHATAVERVGSLLVSRGGPVELLLMSSLEWEPSGRTIDFAWFDSLYELRAQEFRHFRGVGALTEGSIVGFHDWTSGLRGHYMDVREEIEELRRQGLLVPIYIPTPRGVCLAEVR